MEEEDLGSFRKKSLSFNFKAFFEFEDAAEEMNSLSEALSQEIALLKGLGRLQKLQGKHSCSGEQLKSLYEERKACIETHAQKFNKLRESLPQDQKVLIKPLSINEPVATVTLELHIPKKSESEVEKARRLVREIVTAIISQH